MKLKATISITTAKLEVYELGINMRKQRLRDGKATIQVPAGERVNLFWAVRGAPETAYKIEIKPIDCKLAIDGKHPIEQSIAKGVTAGGGHRYFSLESL